jgi:uncharacterized delta-60 repeat protein
MTLLLELGSALSQEGASQTLKLNSPPVLSRVDTTLSKWIFTRNASIFSIISQESNTIVAGEFSQIGNQKCSMVAVLNPDGSLDNKFQGPKSVHGFANAVVAYPDGKILVGGTFDQIDGIKYSRLARFRPDGRTDQLFSTTNGPDGEVHALCLTVDGKILVGGTFRHIGGGEAHGFARLNQDGSIDPTFQLHISGLVYSIKLDSLGRVYAVGDLNRLSPYLSANDIDNLDEFMKRLVAHSDPASELIWSRFPQSTRQSISTYKNAATDQESVASLNEIVNALNNIIDGPCIYDTNRFQRSHMTRYAQAVVDKYPGRVAANTVNRILLEDQFPFIIARPNKVQGVYRLRPDGSLDDSFLPPANSDGVRALLLGGNGDIFIAGRFSNLAKGNFHSLAKLRSDGTVCLSFSPSIEGGEIQSMSFLADGRILIAGHTLRSEQQEYEGLLIINEDGTTNVGWHCDAIHGMVFALATDYLGRAYIGGMFHIEEPQGFDNLCRLQ